MATYGNIPKYHDQNLPGPDLQGLPHSLGSQGCAAWLPATTAMKVEHTWKKQRGKQRSSKMFQDVSTVTKRCLNFRSSFSDFRRSLLHVSYDLTKSGKHGKRRSMSPLQFSKPGTWLWISWQHQIPYFVPLRTAKKNDWPFGKHGLLENPLFSLMIFPLKPSFGGIFQLTFDFPIFEAIFSLRPWPVGISFGEVLWSSGNLLRLSGFTVSPKKHLNKRTPMKHVKHSETVHKSSTIQLCMETGDTF